MENYFTKLNGINVSDKTEKKNGLTYLSWAWAWGELKKLYPDASYTVYENAQGWNYHTDGRTCWVKTGVTVNGIEHIEELPVMDYRNQSITAEKVTSVDVNKAIQRSLTKAIGRHGLGLYIYAGEDLPETDEKGPEEISFGKYCAEQMTNAAKPKAGKDIQRTDTGTEQDEYDPAFNQAKLSKLALEKGIAMEEIAAAIQRVTGKPKKAKELTQAEFGAVLQAL